ncbi:HAD family hydrolase [Chengkuizengella axinellae]|uniref:HAD family hydrolase n=1 Tax=Chengkuizengella axinellae TaxID=3064388 RepID=A0ABT9J693_9BACL|nr:HAD family hydrolase [Chengkuizengella sp. 2205SS18-9]MDP5277129.1 HAD family hydrolase [Chengkuizengella sp. 2205SS18-9]
MNSQSILFDLDDTLIHCNKYYKNVLDTFIELMKDWFGDYGISKQQLKEKQLEIDIHLVEKHGFSAGHFPLSLVKTYDFFCKITPIEINKTKKKLLKELGETVYSKDVEAYPKMYETLEKLRADGHHLHLYTGGEDAIQYKKIKHLGLEEYFEKRIYITRHKTVHALKDIVMKQQLEVKETWMIGNSLRTDVKPSLQVGLNTIHIPCETEWKYNIVELNIKPKSLFYTITSLHEVPGYIDQGINKRVVNE